ncbi:MAG: ABC transporter permease [Clostridia bacterium]|nr:ABC transporter permease [Clostridia bacterium]
MNNTAKQKTGFFRKDGVKSVIASLICILGGILFGFLVLVLLAAFNENIPVSKAFTGIYTVLIGPFSAGSPELVIKEIGDMLFQATPLIMTGVSVALAFKTGLFNIGAPGQYLMGAMGTMLVALSIPTSVVPAWIVWILALITGTAMGVIWGAIPGFFKAKFNVNEVIVCIMTNWIAGNIVSWVFKESRYINYAETKMNFLSKTSSNGVATPGAGHMLGTSSMDISIFIASAVAIIIYIMLNKTTFGFELRACGFNKNAAKYAGMNEKRNIVLSMAIAGGLSAFGAALWCLNGTTDFLWEAYQTMPADGFNGIPAALLASNNPIGVIFSSVFLKYLVMGGSNLGAYTSFNDQVPNLITAVIIYFSGAAKLIKDLLSRKKKQLSEEKMRAVSAPVMLKADDGEANGAEAPAQDEAPAADEAETAGDETEGGDE